MNRRSGRLLACLLVLGLVSACQTPAVAPERFALEAAQSPSLVVRVRQPRRVQAVVGDVDHLLVTVKAADGAEPTQRVDKASFTGSDASVSFTSLASGAATVEVRAFDATSRVLGRASVQATVTPGVLTQVDVPLQLDPVYTQQPVAPQAPGDVALTVPITDGFYFPNLTGSWGKQIAVLPLVQPATEILPGIDFDNGFNQYDYFYIVPDTRGGLLYSAGTTVMNVLSDNTVIEFPSYSIGAASDGHARIWVLRPDSKAVHRHAIADPLTPQTVALPNQPVAYGIVADAQDHVWVSNGNVVSKVAPDGTVVGHYDVGGAAGELAVDMASGDVWVIADQKELVRLSASGAELARTRAGVLPGDVLADVAVDGRGQVWVPQPHGRRVVKLGPDGVIRQTFPVFSMPEAVACGADGNTYVATYTDLVRIDADGALAAFQGHWMQAVQNDYSPEPVPMRRAETRVSAASDGTVWHLYKAPYMSFYCAQVAP